MLDRDLDRRALFAEPLSKLRQIARSLQVGAQDEQNGFAPGLRLSRRGLLKVVAGLASLAISIPSLWPGEALAEEWVYATNKPWQDRNWFPLDPDVAARWGLVTPDGPLAKYDQLHRFFLQQDSNLQPTFRDFANDLLSRFSNAREWIGFCHGLAHLNLGPQPPKAPEIFTLDNGEAITVTYRDRLGIGVAFHSGDIMTRPILGDDLQTQSTLFVQENLDRFMDELVNTGQPFVINAPAYGQVGYWYRVAYAVSADRSSLLATNFNTPGRKFISVPRDRVIEVYYPVLQQEAVAQGVDQRLFAEIPSDWRFDNRMDEALVRCIVYGEQLS